MKKNLKADFDMDQLPQEPSLNLETIIETSLYTNDLTALEHFYSQILNLPVIGKEEDRHVFFMVGSKSVLLIFNPANTLSGHHLPSHGTTGSGHVAFGVQAEQLNAWRARLIDHKILIEKEMTWPRGGSSIYFRDPAGNSVELITPDVWGTQDGW